MLEGKEEWRIEEEETVADFFSFPQSWWPEKE
jgi:hypothetical protein